MVARPAMFINLTPFAALGLADASALFGQHERAARGTVRQVYPSTDIYVFGQDADAIQDFVCP